MELRAKIIKYVNNPWGGITVTIETDNKTHELQSVGIPEPKIADLINRECLIILDNYDLIKEIRSVI